MPFKKGHKAWKPKLRICKECGNIFLPNSANHFWCHNPCVSPILRYKTIKYWTIVGIRSIYSKTKKDFPELANKIKYDMMAEEGEEFTEMVLNGI